MTTHKGITRVYYRTKSGNKSRSKKCGWNIYNDLKNDPVYKPFLDKMKVYDDHVEFCIWW